MLSGGSTVSVSLIWLATTLTVQTVPAGRVADGVRVNVVAGDEVCEKLSGVPVGHAVVNALLVAVTDSLKAMSMVVSRATSVAPSAGDVLLTVGAVSCVVNENIVSEAGWSGGSPVSTSLIFAAIAVTVQLAAPGRSWGVGSSVIELVPEPLTLNAKWVNWRQRMSNELVSTVSGSLSLTVMLAVGSTFVAASAGVVEVTAGA